MCCSCCSRDFRVYRFNDMKNPCRKLCGNISYDDTYQGCCQGIVHDLIGNKDECCGSSTINSYSTECCGGQFPLSRTGSMKCCGDRDLYNEKHSICRKNKVSTNRKFFIDDDDEIWKKSMILMRYVFCHSRNTVSQHLLT